MPVITKSREDFVVFLNNLNSEQKQQLGMALTQKMFKLAHIRPLLTPQQTATLNEFMNNHTLTFLGGGGNSKNFEITNPATQESFVLKLEERLGAPPMWGVGVDVQYFLTPRYFSEDIELSKNSNDKALVITEKCNKGDLTSYAATFANDQTKIQAASIVYSQMIDFFIALQKNGIIMPDAKNTNFLLHWDTDVNPPKLRLKVADDKSFLPTRDGQLTLDLDTFIYSQAFEPPETFYPIFDAEPYHSYILGKNIYQFLTSCNNDTLYNQPKNALNWDFCASIFQTNEGKELVKLIQQLAVFSPEKRITLTDAKEALHAFNRQAFPAPIVNPRLDAQKTQCKILYKDIIKQRIKHNDIAMGEFCATMPQRIVEAVPESAPPCRRNLRPSKNQSIPLMFNSLSV